MNNETKLKNAFKEALDLPVEQISDLLAYGDQNWDSVAHMALIAAIEQEFEIMIDTDDVIDMSSFQKAKEIVIKYGVDLNAQK
ncbi:MAG: acyl carrier protein [Ignavibacteriae bacterium]|nr:acyl carrier protein [Ignavibacteriota bacterium]